MLPTIVESLLREAELLEARARGYREAAVAVLEDRQDGEAERRAECLLDGRKLSAHKIWALLRRQGIGNLDRLAELSDLKVTDLHETINGRMADPACREAVHTAIGGSVPYEALWGAPRPEPVRSFVSHAEVKAG